MTVYSQIHTKSEKEIKEVIPSSLSPDNEIHQEINYLLTTV